MKFIAAAWENAWSGTLLVGFLSALGHASFASLAFLQAGAANSGSECSAEIYDFVPGMHNGSFLCIMDMTAVVCFIEGSGQVTAVLHSMASWRPALALSTGMHDAAR